MVHVQKRVLHDHVGPEPAPHDLAVDAPARRQPPQGLARAEQEREGEPVGGHPRGAHGGVGRERVLRGAAATAAAPGEALDEGVVRDGGGGGPGGVARGGRRGGGERGGDEGREEARSRGEAAGEELGMGLQQVARGL